MTTVTKGQHTDSPFNKPRSRGIRASQQKLRTAQLAAGFKSQAEVVDKIQQIEGLKKAPRSLVSRVFRGESVDPLSIERVAKALDVQAWALYLDSAEVDHQPSGGLLESDDTSGIQTDEVPPSLSAQHTHMQTPINSEMQSVPQAEQNLSKPFTFKAPSADDSRSDGDNSPSQPHASERTHQAPPKEQEQEQEQRKNKRLPFLVITLIVLLGVLVIDRFWPMDDLNSAGNTLAGVVDIDNKVVAVIPIKGRRGADITRSIEQLLAGPTQLIVGSSALHAGVQSPQELLRNKKADLVISAELIEIGRYIAVRLFLSRDEDMQQVWSGVFSKSSSQQYIELQLKKGLNTLLTKRPIADIADWYSLQRFLNGMKYFEGERSEQVILRAMADFQRVISSAPNLVHGYAGMCAALVEQNLETSDKNNLEEASRYCSTGFEIEPDSVFIQNALGNLARVKGDYLIANAHFEQALHTDPNDITALQKMAESQMRIFLKSREPELFSRISSQLAHAAELEPDNWKIPYTQGRAHYFKGDQLGAIEYFSRAAELSVNYQTLNNLAALQFCVGDLQNAKTHYQRALTLKPQHAVLLSNIAVLHFYLGESQQALDIFEPQIKRITEEGGPGLYQLWSNVADVYRTQGNSEKALQAYHNAMSELDREVSKGEANVMQKASRLAMYILVTELSPELQTTELLASLKKQAEALNAAADPVSLHQLALSWLHLGNEEKARYYRDKLKAICPGFAASPDFQALEPHTM
ncbi:Tetratricopeptide TPR_2 [Paraglaciecola sp. T6c]|uniref:tetratricopeptide repeat protein n=1 Tax=Pseudoalteromonas atlantica (strain T6c / ATCC BAA-1087) TaxID=3042615 RepID=UPI00005C7118|nr:tetratricopeptide repeat protein [Paraglaciecola sp. T6c]ABG40025.1 Tetratricopeptide TPR_2 [Paraglaciecola sp. T6c]